MKALNTLTSHQIKLVFTDIDGTLTDDGRIPASSYAAMWSLAESGIRVVPVTGRPAGWCEMIARTWPVHGVIGENGALYFSYQNKKMLRHYLVNEKDRITNRTKLNQIQSEILKKIPGAGVASDQFTRLFDLAIDFCEDVKPLAKSEVQKIVEIFHQHGATAKVSSIHVNGWFGQYDKKTMCRLYCERELNYSLPRDQKFLSFIGDSPNDEPMFEFFENSFAVANIAQFKDQLKTLPKYISPSPEAKGFVEFAEHLIKLL